MSSQPQDRDNQLGHFAGLILVLTFIAIFFIISANSREVSFSPSVPPAEGDLAVAEAAPTDTPPPAPTDTLPPPTDTPTIGPTYTPTPTDTPAPTDTPVPTDTPQPVDDDEDARGEVDAAADYDPEMIAQGEQLYAQCAACHGADARGIPGLGKDLVDTEYMQTHTDEEVQQLVIMGRPIWDPDNTTGIDMPSRGGNPALSNDDIMAIIAYLRSLSDDQPEAQDATEEADTAGADEAAYDPEMIAQGENLFASCAACHGADARGIPGLGKDLVATEYMQTHTDEEVKQLVISGRPIWDPDNTTGIEMPSRGGNPTLSDDDVLAIIAYLRSLDN
jgi:cbb3-type cytochrome c oxidase subunit III